MLQGLLLQLAIKTALTAIAGTHPEFGDALKTIAPTVEEATAKIATRAATTVTADPVIQNQMNAESPIQSRVVVGSSASLFGVAAMILAQFYPDYDWVTLFAAIPVVWGAGYALYGRLASGLKPLFHRS